MFKINTTCWVCGQDTNAGVYPPVCSEGCRKEWDLETEFNKFVKIEMDKMDKYE